MSEASSSEESKLKGKLVTGSEDPGPSLEEKLSTRVDKIREETRGISKQLLSQAGGKGTAQFIATHELINKLVRSAQERVPDEMYGLINVLYETVVTLTDG